MTRLSIVIPSHDDGELVRQRIAELAPLSGVELVVVESGNPAYRSHLPGAGRGVRFLTGGTGRGAQMNRGAAAANGEVLLFLHADCSIGAEGVRALAELPARYVGGCFRQRNRLPFETERRRCQAFQKRAWGFVPRRSYRVCAQIWRLVIRAAELRIDYRTRVRGQVFGDQGIFVRRAVFAGLQGYREDLPMFEDLEFFRRLRRRGPVRLMPQRILSEPRRWFEIGLLNYGRLTRRATRLYEAGVEPRIIARWFRRRYAQHLRRSPLPFVEPD